jgi:methyl-accepting chemotaxis protein
MSSNNKMDTSEVFAMFETINNKLDKRTDKPVESVPVDLSAVNAMAERFERFIEEVRKPEKIEHHHRHTFDIRSNWFFFSWIVLVIIIFALFWTIANQRQTISQYMGNDLKYRHIKMQGQTNEESLYRLERQFKYSDSIKIIRRQVEEYEELVEEQAERMERAKQNSEEVKKILEKVESLKNNR